MLQDLAGHGNDTDQPVDPEALFSFFKNGGYLVHFQVSENFSGKVMLY